MTKPLGDREIVRMRAIGYVPQTARHGCRDCVHSTIHAYEYGVYNMRCTLHHIPCRKLAICTSWTFGS